MDEQTINRIKRYLNKKINPRVIALELCVSLEVVNECEKQLIDEAKKQEELARKQRMQQVNNKTSKITNSSYLKMVALRERYKKAYQPDSTDTPTKTRTDTKTNKVTELTKDKLQEAEMLIVAIEEKATKISRASGKEARILQKELIEDAKQLQPLQPLPLELALRFKNAVATMQIRKLSKEDRLPIVMENVKIMSVEKLIQAVDILQESTKDIEELKRISLLLTPDMERQNKLSVGMIKNKIQRKIQAEQQRIAMEKIKNIPSNLSEIIESIADGEVDIGVAVQTIEQEARKRVSSKTQKRSFMAPSEEQEKRQISMQILNAIRENPNKYQFKNPDVAIHQIQAICGAEKGETIRSIVTNLIGRKRFETAKRICRKFEADNQDVVITTYINRLFQDIKNAEVANTVLEAIKMEGTPQEQAAYYDSIEMQLKSEGVNPSAVLLGTNFDGTKQIKLSDIWLSQGKNKSEINRG